jgi:lysine 2,3-aminomutase
MHKNRDIKELIERHSFLKDALLFSDTQEEFCQHLQNRVDRYFAKHPDAKSYLNGTATGRKAFDKLSWQDYGAIRLADFLKNEGRQFTDPNMHGRTFTNHPLSRLWQAVIEKNEIAGDVISDLTALFDQFGAIYKHNTPSKEKVLEWMGNHPSGVDEDIVAQREENRDRIIKVLIKELKNDGYKKGKYTLPKNLSEKDEYETVLGWWNESSFHLSFAIRETESLNEMLDFSLDKETLDIMQEAEGIGLPVFVNPYYLSLLNPKSVDGLKDADRAIRMYIFYSRSLLDEFGQISAWEKEDEVVPGKPNAAGWILPSHNLHRRYPEVAILIPDTIGRACGGLCSSCQRMYGFQSGDLNFDLDRLAPKESWPEKLDRLLEYYENDSQLRDILLTGGDALMSSDKSLKQILDKIYDMAIRKIETNKKTGRKFAEIKRIRLGSRLPVYLPQRITDSLIKVLTDFREKARKIGISQLLIQTHFESAMEITPEAAEGVKKLLSAGWYVTNQQVFTSTASLRGHTAKLRKELNDIGVLTYYTFTVKGFKENRSNFATNARALQEQLEEKTIGTITSDLWAEVTKMSYTPETLLDTIGNLREKSSLPFLATDRNVINLPGVGKSQTFRTIGLTEDGRRILLFAHDTNRTHSPITDSMDDVVIIESKTISQFLREVEEMGEDSRDYSSLYGYSLSETEPLMPIFKYPIADITEDISNFEMP